MGSLLCRGELVHAAIYLKLKYFPWNKALSLWKNEVYTRVHEHLSDTRNRGHEKDPKNTGSGAIGAFVQISRNPIL